MKANYKSHCVAKAPSSKNKSGKERTVRIDTVSPQKVTLQIDDK